MFLRFFRLRVEISGMSTGPYKRSRVLTLALALSACAGFLTALSAVATPAQASQQLSARVNVCLKQTRLGRGTIRFVARRHGCKEGEQLAQFVTVSSPRFHGPGGISVVPRKNDKRGDSSRRGPAGPRGAKGERGEPGPRGKKGTTGRGGEQGPTGPQGEQGSAGAKGDKGEQGLPGLTGAQGEKGEQGEASNRIPPGSKARKASKGKSVV